MNATANLEVRAVRREAPCGRVLGLLPAAVFALGLLLGAAAWAAPAQQSNASPPPGGGLEIGGVGEVGGTGEKPPPRPSQPPPSAAPSAQASEAPPSAAPSGEPPPSEAPPVTPVRKPSPRPVQVLTLLMQAIEKRVKAAADFGKITGAQRIERVYQELEKILDTPVPRDLIGPEATRGEISRAILSKLDPARQAISVAKAEQVLLAAGVALPPPEVGGTAGQTAASPKPTPSPSVSPVAGRRAAAEGGTEGKKDDLDLENSGFSETNTEPLIPPVDTFRGGR